MKTNRELMFYIMTWVCFFPVRYSNRIGYWGVIDPLMFHFLKCVRFFLFLNSQWFFSIQVYLSQSTRNVFYVFLMSLKRSKEVFSRLGRNEMKGKFLERKVSWKENRLERHKFLAQWKSFYCFSSFPFGKD